VTGYAFGELIRQSTAARTRRIDDDTRVELRHS
jgi:hypothetical protein